MDGLQETRLDALGATIPPVLDDANVSSTETRLSYALRIGAGLCFIGHGAFGVITKPEWVPYFGVVGIPEEWAYTLMPLVGLIDIVAGISVIVSPRPIALVYMVLWALWTALLRPLSGDNVWETLERAGNYGVPLALLVLAGGRDALRGWRAAVRPLPLTSRLATRLTWTLRVTTSLLLFGHGGLAVIGKPLLLRHFDAIGLGSGSLTIAGGVEIALAIAILVRPAVPLLVIVAAWKLASESLFLVAGAPVWEVVERAGSYVAPIALAMVLVHIRYVTRLDGGAR
jgi:hypothetical protein